MRKYIPLLLYSVLQVNIVYAQTSLFDYITLTNNFIARLIPLIIGLGMLFFLWGTARFLFSKGDEKVLEETKRLMRWGIITLFVMISIWGIIKVIQGDLFGSYSVYNVGIQN